MRSLYSEMRVLRSEVKILNQPIVNTLIDRSYNRFNGKLVEMTVILTFFSSRWPGYVK